jgi:hypothetical protein
MLRSAAVAFGAFDSGPWLILSQAVPGSEAPHELVVGPATPMGTAPVIVRFERRVIPD